MSEIAEIIDINRKRLIIKLVEKAYLLTGRKTLKEEEKLELAKEWGKILVNIPTDYLEEVLDLALRCHEPGQVFIVSEITKVWKEDGRRLRERREAEKLSKQPNCNQCNDTGWILEIRKAARRCPNKCLAKTNDDKSQATMMPADFAASLKQFFSKTSFPRVSYVEDYEYEQR